MVGMVRVVRVVAARAARVAGVVGVVAVRAVRVARMGAGDGEGADAVPWFPIPAASAGGGCSSTKERNKLTCLRVFPNTRKTSTPKNTWIPPLEDPSFSRVHHVVARLLALHVQYVFNVFGGGVRYIAYLMYLRISMYLEPH